MNVRLVRLLLLGAAVLAGCQQEEEIRRYQVPRDQALPKLAGPNKTPAPPTSGPQRLLVGMFPRPDSIWYFRLDGPVDQVKEQAEAFEKLVRSVRFTGKESEPVAWTLPEGWKQEPAKGLRYATLRAGPLEGRVTRLGVESGSVLQNLTRFRGEVGLSDATEADLAKDTRPLAVEGSAGTWIDVTGPGKRPMR